MGPTDLRRRFAELHDGELFLMPNPWDVGSAKLLEAAGFPALATTSAGLAWSLGRDDYGIARHELLDHVAAITAAVGVPLNVDAERCFGDTPEGVAETVRLLHDAGAAGCSIEDWDLATGAPDPIEVAAERVAAAAEAAHADPGDALVLTARCEHFVRDLHDLDHAIDRLVRYREAGADCVYAPGLRTIEQVRAVVDAVEAPVNVLAIRTDPSVAELAAAGVRRVSVGGGFASIAYGAMLRAAEELRDAGTTTSFTTGAMRPEDRAALR